MATVTKTINKSTNRRKEKSERRGKKNANPLVFSEFEVDGTVYKTTLPSRFQQNKKWKPKDLGEIEALITGVIKKIFVEKDAPVKKGDCVLLLEAMKMNNEILSPFDGTVQDIYVTENSNVSKGTLMIKISQETVSPD